MTEREGEQRCSSAHVYPRLRWGLVDNTMPRVHYYRREAPTPTAEEAGWASVSVWKDTERRRSLAPTGPDSPAGGELLYRLSYPSPHTHKKNITADKKTVQKFKYLLRFPVQVLAKYEDLKVESPTYCR
jgi:hypothetical protein